MTGLIERLVMTLDKDCDIYEEVLRLGEEKREVIVQGDIQKLEKITKREHALIASLMRLEQIRDTLISEIVQTKGIENVKAIDDIIQAVDVDSQDSLLTVKRRLNHLMKEVKTVNDTNSKLIEQSLDIIDFNINLITTTGEVETNYGNEANINYHKQRWNGFDAKV